MKAGMRQTYASQLLSVLRLIRTVGHGNQGWEVIKRILDDNVEGRESAVLRVAAYIADIADGAIAEIEGSGLPSEAASGLIATANGVKGAFSMARIHSPMNGFLPAIDASISNFVILLSTQGLLGDHPAQPEVEELLNDIDEFTASFRASDLGSEVKETVIKHMAILRNLLVNVSAFGVEAALAAYAEMIVRLRRAEASTPDRNPEQKAKLWEAVERWGKRLSSIDTIANKAGAIANHAEKLPQLLTYLPL